MKLLIAIPTCEVYAGNAGSANRNEAERREACRDTWLKNCPIDYKFFYGGGRHKPEADEVTLNCPEGYDYLSTKYKAMCQWTLEHGYDYQLRIDTDAYLWVHRLLLSGFDAHEYSGFTIDYPEHLAMLRYASGAGWTIGRQGMRLVAGNEPGHPADDLWVGRLLFKHGIRCHRETRFCCGFAPHFVPLDKLPEKHSNIILHALRPEDIREVHKRPYPGDEFKAPAMAMLEPKLTFGYGKKSVLCECEYCQS